MPNSHDPLTDAAVKALRPGRTPIDVRDAGQTGLLVTVLPSGLKQFSTRYRFRGKHRRFVLGAYPSLSLAAARKAARTAHAAIDAGRDPAAEQRAEKAPRADTVAALAADYLAKHARVHKRSAAGDERTLRVEVLPRWKDRSVRELTRRDVRVLVERIAERGAPIMANRTLALVRRMLNFGVAHDWIDANPAAQIEQYPERSRDRVLTDDEIRRLWRVLSRFPTTAERGAPGRKATKGTEDDPICPVSSPQAAILKLRLLTAQRGGEVARMRWQDVTFQTETIGNVEHVTGWWIIPGVHAKNGESHRVFLGRDAVALIREQAPSAPEDCGEGVFVRAGAASVMDRTKKAPAAVARVLGFDFRGHDLRRTAATLMAEAGIPRADVSRVLNHAEGARATRVYDRYAGDREKRVALETWERVLTRILTAQPGGAAVVPFGRVR